MAILCECTLGNVKFLITANNNNDDDDGDNDDDLEVAHPQSGSLSP